MIRLAHVLCPVDFSEIARHALDHAAAIARWYKARLTLVYVFANLPPVELPRIREAAVADARRKLQEQIPERARTYCTVETAAVEGRAYREVLTYATERQVDLIVMGVHGRGASICWCSARRRTTSFVRQRARSSSSDAREEGRPDTSIAAAPPIR